MEVLRGGDGSHERGIHVDHLRAGPACGGPPYERGTTVKPLRRISHGTCGVSWSIRWRGSLVKSMAGFHDQMDSSFYTGTCGRVVENRRARAEGHLHPFRLETLRVA